MRIKISYKTGNSFMSISEIDYVDLEWNDIKKAKESLERIKNHYEYCLENYDIWNKPMGELPKGVVWNNKYRIIMLELITDEGKPYLYSPFWTGHFETLYYAEIVNNEDMIYRP